MGRCRASKLGDEGTAFPPDRSPTSRLKGQRRAVLRHLYRTLLLRRDVKDAKTEDVGSTPTAGGGRPRWNRRQRQRHKALAASLLFGVGAGLHMVATLWHRPPPLPPPAEGATDQEDGMDDLQSTVIWAGFWFAVTDLLGWNPAVVLYGAITVLSFFFSAPDGGSQDGVGPTNGEWGVEPKMEELGGPEEVPILE